ncbi:MAG: DoxX family protein [Gammaproteobacteria bacterium]|nr:DoxX family protein [Gammaproteobacteria bacterium]MBU6509062.1 DoxX family protein [Gammaproteobacteria bacterium]MDE1984394.1 DoxX family protein [Gammaproteobacteria bacterium]MDE2108740.1 DoxX family protein [Gammaproteobacteria bacterium]MDE2460025.1 DoxX family protein [Gammaproteobacteria bacterium]
MTLIARATACYAGTTSRLAMWLGSVTLLCMRVWVALAFWQAGLVKIASPETTRYLFENIYHVPLLPPDFAASLGTWIELIVPWFIGLGLLSRPFALFLFIYNIIAFISYPALWPHGFWYGLFSTAAFADHKIWGLMLMAVIAWGPGKLSLDALAEWTYHRCRGITALTCANS